MKNWIKLLSTMSFVVFALAANTATAQATATPFPDKPLRIVVTFTTGGAPDLLARILSEKLSNVWGQPVIVDNKPGAGGNTGADFVVKRENGVGLNNVEQRLRNYYGDAASLKIESRMNEGTLVKLKFPTTSEPAVQRI